MSSNPIQKLVDELETQAAFAKLAQEEETLLKNLPGIRAAGIDSLEILLPIAHGNSGQCRYVACFLLGLYNGERFPFNLNDLRCLDTKIANDCLDVLRMDLNPEKEVHMYFENGEQIFEDLAKAWNVKDRTQLT